MSYLYKSLDYPGDDYKTVRQWEQKFMKPKKGEAGTWMYSNRYCVCYSQYFTEDEVEPMNEAEKAEIRKERANKARERRYKEEIRKIYCSNLELYEIGMLGIPEKYIFLTEYKRRERKARKIYEAIRNTAAILPEAPKETICIDIETTGLHTAHDEILQVAVLDLDGNTLLNTYVKPYKKNYWKAAENLNGISPEMVKDAAEPEEVAGILKGLIASAKNVIIFNSYFVRCFLLLWEINITVKSHNIYDVMMQHSKFGQYVTLKECAAYYGYPEFKRYDALEDCKATLHCYKHMPDIKANEFY